MYPKEMTQVDPALKDSKDALNLEVWPMQNWIGHAR